MTVLLDPDHLIDAARDNDGLKSERELAASQYHGICRRRCQAGSIVLIVDV